MKISNIENIRQYTRNVRFDKLSPSTFISLKNGCKYKHVLHKANKINIDINGKENTFVLPPSNNTLLGIVIHKMFELRVKGKIREEADFTNYWNKAVSKIENEQIEVNSLLMHGFLTDYYKMLKTKEAVFSIPHTTNSRTIVWGRNKKVEVGIWNVKYLHGAIDKIEYSRNKIEIIDYKTGNIFFGQNLIKPEYEVQLKLYAVLYERSFHQKVDSLSIVDLKGNRINVDFSENELYELYEKVQEIISQLNTRLAEESYVELVSMNNSSCYNCSCRGICDYYWNNSNIKDGDIDGSLIKIYANHVIDVQITNSERIKIKDLYSYHIEDLSSAINRKIRVVNAFPLKEMSYGKLYAAKEWTKIYELG